MHVALAAATNHKLAPRSSNRAFGTDLRNSVLPRVAGSKAAGPPQAVKAKTAVSSTGFTLPPAAGGAKTPAASKYHSTISIYGDDNNNGMPYSGAPGKEMQKSKEGGTGAAALTAPRRRPALRTITNEAANVPAGKLSAPMQAVTSEMSELAGKAAGKEGERGGDAGGSEGKEGSGAGSGATGQGVELAPAAASLSFGDEAGSEKQVEKNGASAQQAAEGGMTGDIGVKSGSLARQEVGSAQGQQLQQQEQLDEEEEEAGAEGMSEEERMQALAWKYAEEGVESWHGRQVEQWEEGRKTEMMEGERETRETALLFRCLFPQQHTGSECGWE